jgi:succinate dehydrogenase/fumarate reductase cytochrome b subunit
MMEALLRPIAVFIEVLLLAAVFYCILAGVRLMLFDLGITRKYSNIITLMLLAVGAMVVVFLSSHLSAFYPEI